MARENMRSAAVRMAEVPRVCPFIRSGDDEAQGDGKTLDGFASVFNALTVIDSWEGRFKEQFLSGSMRKSFREQTPIIQFDHGRHPMIGSLPVARFEKGYPVEETDPVRAPDGGARVLARMHEAPLFEPVREVIASGTVNGMSIRFGVTREKWYRPDGSQVKDAREIEQELLRTWLEDVPDDELLRRDIVEASVAEMGPVVWPAYAQTSVGVRSLLDSMSGDQRRALVREIAAELRRDTDITVEFDIDARDGGARVLAKNLIAAPGARSAGGEGDDVERQAAETSTRTTSSRQKADDDALRLRGIPLERKVTHQP